MAGKNANHRRRSPRARATVARASVDTHSTKKPRRARDWQWFVLAAALPLALEAPKLDQDLFGDESYTIEHFVSQPFHVIAATYTEPNNHVLYSIVLRPFFLISDSTFMLRLPSLLCSAATLALVFRLGRTLGGVQLGVLGTLVLGLSEMFQVYGMQVRGYILSMLLAAALANLAVTPAGGSHAARRALGIAVVAALFLYVLPSNLLLLAPLAASSILWVAWQTRELRTVLAEAAAWTAGHVLGLLCYAPIWSQVRALGHGPSVHAADVARLMSGTFAFAARDAAPLVALLLVVGAWRVYQAVRHGDYRWLLACVLIVVLIVSPFVLIWPLQVKPFVRNFSPLLPVASLVLAWPLAVVLDAAARRFSWPQSPALALAAVAVATMLFVPRFFAPARASAPFRPSAVVDYLVDAEIWREPYIICFTDADQYDLGYYFKKYDFPYRRTAGRAGETTEARVYLVTTREADYEALAKKCSLPADRLRGFTLIEDFGHYRLQRSPALERIMVPND